MRALTPPSWRPKYVESCFALGHGGILWLGIKPARGECCVQCSLPWVVWGGFLFCKSSLLGPKVTGCWLKPMLQKRLKRGFILSGKTPRMTGITGTGRGLQCGLSGNLAPKSETIGSGLNGKPPVWRQPAAAWESLLDLSHNIYPACCHLSLIHTAHFQ